MKSSADTAQSSPKGGAEIVNERFGKDYLADHGGMHSFRVKGEEVYIINDARPGDFPTDTPSLYLFHKPRIEEVYNYGAVSAKPKGVKIFLEKIISALGIEGAKVENLCLVRDVSMG